MRAWAAAAPAALSAFGEAVADAQALPPCHGGPEQAVSGPEDGAAAPHSPAPSWGLCDCCLSCSPAAAGALPLSVPVAPGPCGPPACAPVPPIQALPDGLFRPPRR